ncbi:hypothetical protein KFE98_08680 [bacterium SCSIO 12741]|nr:hypothetical protein KFE98_08680 [bacterium SCSIO 12741]
MRVFFKTEQQAFSGLVKRWLIVELTKGKSGIDKLELLIRRQEKHWSRMFSLIQ